MTAETQHTVPTSIAAQWRDLVTAALLGTDRRDPPAPWGPVAELVADTVRASPSERMLAQVAAVTAVRRAGVLPGDPQPVLIAPDSDERPEVVPAATERWCHITSSWPVLEDEWTIAVIANGWRVSTEMIPALLRRHRSDRIRHARARVAAGPVADWLIDQLPEFAAAGAGQVVDAATLLELPGIPLPGPQLDGHATTGVEFVSALEGGAFGPPHRALLVNLVARAPVSELADLVALLGAVDAHAPGAGLAAALGDLATTRRRMLDELRQRGSVSSTR